MAIIKFREEGDKPTKLLQYSPFQENNFSLKMQQRNFLTFFKRAFVTTTRKFLCSTKCSTRVKLELMFVTSTRRQISTSGLERQERLFMFAMFAKTFSHSHTGGKSDRNDSATKVGLLLVAYFLCRICMYFLKGNEPRLP